MKPDEASLLPQYHVQTRPVRPTVAHFRSQTDGHVIVAAARHHCYHAEIMSLSVDALVRLMSAALAPVIVISGAGLLLLSMTNRYGRIIDRARHLSREIETAGPTGVIHHVQGQLQIVWRQARMLRFAILMNALCILLVAMTVLVVFVEALAGAQRDFVAGWIFGFGLVALVISMGAFLRDITVSLRALKLELSRNE